MTKEELANSLTGREYPLRIEKIESALAKRNRLLIVWGASDDLVELDGIICDELGTGDFYIDRDASIIPEFEDGDEEVLKRHGVLSTVQARRKTAIKITPCWCADGQPDWTYTTEEPHATFDIMEDGRVFCRGMVIQL